MNGFVKTFCIFAALNFSVMLLSAQTNTNAEVSVTISNKTAVSTNNLSTQIVIQSDSWDFDLETKQAVYHGHVRVKDPQLKLTCEQLTADLPANGGHPHRIVAETNVVVDVTNTDHQVLHITSDKAVYIYNMQNGVTNETVTFTGHAKAEYPQYTLTGEPIYWDFVNKRLHADNEKTILRQSENLLKVATNSPPETTSIPPKSISNTNNSATNAP
jgi:lipopolysaccharide transport protein LptA